MKKQILFSVLVLCSIALFAQKVEEISIPVAKGITLKADLYHPNVDQGPVILMRTPYMKEGMEIIAERFAQSGYYVVVQDVRGKYSSEGTFVPFLREVEDGEATLKWLENQSWNNGNIGLWGSSYLGYSALSLSASKNPQLKSIFHISGWLDGEEVNTPGGAFHQSLIIPWLVFEGQRSRRNISKMDMNELFAFVPTEEIIPSMYFPTEKGDSVHLSEVSISNTDFPFQESSVPIFHMTGWYDFVLSGVLSAHDHYVKANAGPQHLMIGPWYHNQAYGGAPNVGELELPIDGRMDLEKLMTLSIDWFDQSMKGLGPKIPAVEYYILFQDEWKESENWPPKNTRPIDFFLAENSLIGKQDNAGNSSFIYNPNDPVPTWGGANFHFFMDEMGMKEQSKIEKRADVLSFTTEPFDAQQSFAGPVNVELYFETEGKGTDFTAKLTLVDLDGSSFNISDGIVRVSPSNKQIQKANIKLSDIAFQVKEGQQLRLQISSSNFPKFNRNPNTGVEPLAAKEFKTVKQTIHHGKKYPTKINLHLLEE